MMVLGLPSAKISAAPEAADSVPSVTMKSVMRPRAMSRPLSRPTAKPATSAARIAGTRPIPKTSPKTTAASVIADAIDRSMPAVATTKVCPSASTIRMAADVSIDSMLPRLKKVGLSTWKTIVSTTSAIGAAHAARLAGSRTFRHAGCSAFGWVAAFDAQRLGVCSRHLTSSANGSS